MDPLLLHVKGTRDEYIETHSKLANFIGIGTI
jgi:hypothetical protein